MTEKLYYKDSYIYEFEAKVLSCTSNNDLYDIVLDKTAFFPEGGGQYADKGFIDEAEIIDVQITDETIHHFSKSKIDTNKTVNCKIDKDYRYRNMQSHSGEHIFSGVIHSLFGLENISFHLGNDYITVDYNGVLTKEDILKAEKLSNEAIYANLPINTYFPAAGELNDLEYRSKLDLKENVRIVEIPGIDRCACCAPHVKMTGEIGMIKIIGTTLQNRHIRMKMLCGIDALNYYNMLWDNVEGIAEALSTQPEKILTVFEKTMKDFSDCRIKLNQASKKAAVAEAKAIDISGENICYFADNADIETLRLIVNTLSPKVSGIAIALSGADSSGYIFVAGSASKDMREIAASLRRDLNAKGGGSNIMIQGNIPADKEKIKNYFE